MNLLDNLQSSKSIFNPDKISPNVTVEQGAALLENISDDINDFVDTFKTKNHFDTKKVEEVNTREIDPNMSITNSIL